MKRVLGIGGLFFLVLAIFLSGSQVKTKKKPEMVLIPAGEFVMGKEIPTDNTSQKKKKTYIDFAAHKVYVDSFYMDKYEVTNAQYHRFCKETGHRLPEFWGKDEFHCGLKYPDHPVVGVSHSDAEAYAEWRGMRLPTEAEWEYAARGGLVGKNYPNGDKLDETQANFKPKAGTVKVGSYPPNGYGLYDMVGNVVEWVSDYYHKDYYRESPYKNPKGPEIGKFKVIRGGGWHSGAYCSQVYYRNALPRNWVDFNVGFRCAKDKDE